MKYSAIVEIPKGSDRRIHLSSDRTGFIDLGPIKDQITVNNGVMPVCYGYLEDTHNESDGDNVDVIIFSERSYRTADRVALEILGLLTREDGDHKIIAADDSVSLKSFQDVDAAEKKLVLDYFGCKSKIVSIDSKEKALEYLESSKT